MSEDVRMDQKRNDLSDHSPPRLPTLNRVSSLFLLTSDLPGSSRMREDDSYARAFCQ